MKQPKPIKIGDKVRVLRIPPSVEKKWPEETRQIFRRCVGKILRVDGFGKVGHLELNVKDDGSQSPDYCAHTIWIEPEFVEIV
ncbi:MAG: hypothetical protein NT105_18610 [Verrucomicrobia bacterium]|nr:hypothetical protein [Verrucomicrobiota bacterium]